MGTEESIPESTTGQDIPPQPKAIVDSFEDFDQKAEYSRVYNFSSDYFANRSKEICDNFSSKILIDPSILELIGNKSIKNEKNYENDKKLFEIQNRENEYFGLIESASTKLAENYAKIKLNEQKIASDLQHKIDLIGELKKENQALLEEYNYLKNEIIKFNN